MASIKLWHVRYAWQVMSHIISCCLTEQTFLSMFQSLLENMEATKWEIVSQGAVHRVHHAIFGQF